MGFTGNDGNAAGLAHTASIEHRMAQSYTGSGPFQNRDTNGVSAHAFDNSFERLNSYGQGSRAGTMTAQGGESLSALAVQLYGDASLWYKLAQANPGLSSADAPISAGTEIRLPAGVTRNTHNAATVQPYNPGDAIGDLNPTAPEPPKDAGNCGMIGQLILTVMSVVQTAAFTAVGVPAPIAAAAADFWTQVYGDVLGISEGIDFKRVGISAISAGVAKGVDKVFQPAKNFASAALQGAARNAVTQGISTAVGLQDRFSWSGVAAAGVGAGVGSWLGNKIGLNPLSGKDADLSLGNLGKSVAVGGASALANAATRSALDGSNFGNNIVAAIPDVIGQTLGSVVGTTTQRALSTQYTLYASNVDPAVISDSGPVDEIIVRDTEQEQSSFIGALGKFAGNAVVDVLETGVKTAGALFGFGEGVVRGVIDTAAFFIGTGADVVTAFVNDPEGSANAAFRMVVAPANYIAQAATQEGKFMADLSSAWSFGLSTAKNYISKRSEQLTSLQMKGNLSSVDGIAALFQAGRLAGKDAGTVFSPAAAFKGVKYAGQGIQTFAKAKRGATVWKTPESFRAPKLWKGSWQGQIGNSGFELSDEFAYAANVPRGTVISYVEGTPDFSDFSVSTPAGGSGTFKVDGLKFDHDLDRPIIIRHLAQEANITQQAVRSYLIQNDLRVHHFSGNEIQLVPASLHTGLTHIGPVKKGG